MGRVLEIERKRKMRCECVVYLIKWSWCVVDWVSYLRGDYEVMRFCNGGFVLKGDAALVQQEM